MKQLLAVSGGVDSMAMLHFACQNFPADELIVAHFDHGIRENSTDDANFVRQKAAEYGTQFCLGRALLGPNASEAAARAARYGFLRNLAAECNAQIWTAHHLDDLVESIAINFLRGTGWRGLVALDSVDIYRPFLTEEPWDRAKIWHYAAEHNLTYREDPSNASDEYLRNRLRHQMNNEVDKLALYNLWKQQKLIKNEIDHIIGDIVPERSWSREWFRDLSPQLAMELLRAGTLRAGISATRPQLEDFRQAILNYTPGKYFNLPGDKLVRLDKNTFTF